LPILNSDKVVKHT